MSTRSLTHIHDSDGGVLLTFYKQHDGYPSGWGTELAEALSGFKVVNGLGMEKGKIANGMGCLAAQILANFKDEPGQFYVHPANSKVGGEEYVYRVAIEENAKRDFGAPVGRITLECLESDGKRLFLGKPEDFAGFVATEAENQDV